MTTCGACRHTKASAIDAALRAGEPDARVGRAFSLSRDAVRRHRVGHLADVPTVATATAVLPADDDALDRRLVALQSVLTDAVDAAVRTGKTSALLGASRELRATIESIAKLRGQLSDKPTVNLLTLPAWQDVSGRLLRALDAYPEARAAAARALTGAADG